MTPTEAGDVLAHHARTILHQMNRMRSEVSRYAGGVRASVRIFANTAAITELLPARLAPWMTANPQIDIDLKERPSADIARSVEAGFAEIGVLSSAVDTGTLVLRPFAIDRLVVVTPASEAPRGPVRFEAMLARPFIGLAGGALQDHIEAQATRLGARLQMRVRLRSFSGICRMVGAGAGIGIVPEAAARRCRRTTRIAIHRLHDDWATRRLALCVRDGGDLTAPARAVFDHLADRG